MSSEIYDVITIGGGPSGLVCALTSIGGIPINPPEHFRGMVIDKYDTGEFAKYGKLRVTNKWYFMGHRIIEYLITEAKQAGLALRDHEEVIDVELTDNIKVVKTDKAVYKCKKLAICTGFFPHGNLVKYRRNMRVMFSPIEMEADFIPEEKGYTLAILGGGKGTLSIGSRLKEIRPDINCLVVSEGEISEEEEEQYKNLSLHRGSLKVEKENENNVDLVLLKPEGEEFSRKSVRFVLIDYNSYTLKTDITSFLENKGFILKEGYIKVDCDGNTGIYGVVAAGNIVTPVSGVVTALSTGFTAGLNIYRQLYKEKFNREPLYFPWLPMEGIDSHPLNK